MSSRFFDNLESRAFFSTTGSPIPPPAAPTTPGTATTVNGQNPGTRNSAAPSGNPTASSATKTTDNSSKAGSLPAGTDKAVNQAANKKLSDPLANPPASGTNVTDTSGLAGANAAANPNMAKKVLGDDPNPFAQGKPVSYKDLLTQQFATLADQFISAVRAGLIAKGLSADLAIGYGKTGDGADGIADVIRARIDAHTSGTNPLSAYSEAFSDAFSALLGARDATTANLAKTSDGPYQEKDPRGVDYIPGTSSGGEWRDPSATDPMILMKQDAGATIDLNGHRQVGKIDPNVKVSEELYGPMATSGTRVEWTDKQGQHSKLYSSKGQVLQHTVTDKKGNTTLAPDDPNYKPASQTTQSSAPASGSTTQSGSANNNTNNGTNNSSGKTKVADPELQQDHTITAEEWAAFVAWKNSFFDPNGPMDNAEKDMAKLAAKEVARIMSTVNPVNGDSTDTSRHGTDGVTTVGPKDVGLTTPTTPPSGAPSGSDRGPGPKPGTM